MRKKHDFSWQQFYDTTMKRLPLLGLATLALGMIAFAAETIRFEPALGTVTKYRSTLQSTAEVLNASLVTSDGKPAPASFENILETLKKNLGSTTTEDMTEKVVAIQANGTRQLETTISSSSQPSAQVIGLTLLSTMTPEGVVQVSSVKFDAATLAQPGMTEISDWLGEVMTLAYAQRSPAIYGQGLEVGQTLKQTIPSSLGSMEFLQRLNPTAKVQIEGLQGTLESTYQGRNAVNEYQFKMLSRVTPGRMSLELLGMSLEQTISESRSEGDATYFADGRIKSTRQTASQTLTQIQKFSLGQQILTLTISTKTTTISSTDVVL